MAIYPHRNLLGCRTLRDWTIISKELPQLFNRKNNLSMQRKNAVIYFALQNTALFHACVATYQNHYLVLDGAEELYVLMDFILREVPLLQSTWTLPVPFPGDGSKCSFSNLSIQKREQLLETRIPHSDLSVNTVQEIECLYSYYRDGISDSICFPIS